MRALSLPSLPSLLSLLSLGVLFLAVRSPASDLHVQIKDQHARSVEDAVVIAIPADPKNALRAKPPMDAVDQVDKQFVPFVKVAYVGSTIRFPNSDNVRHQVYSFSLAKKFELPLYAGRDAPPVTFDKPGVVVLGCNIHDWMIGYIYVSETPFFVKTDSTGSATFIDLPPGDYTLRVWHPGMDAAEEAATRHVAVLTDVSMPLDWQIRVKPVLRIPRAAGAASPTYP